MITGTIKEIISQNMNKLYWKNSDNLYNIYILKILGLTDTLDRFRLGSLLSLLNKSLCLFQSEETLNPDISDNSSMTGRQYIPFNLKHAFSIVIVLYVTALDAIDIGVVSKKFCRIKMTCKEEK